MLSKQAWIDDEGNPVDTQDMECGITYFDEATGQPGELGAEWCPPAQAPTGVETAASGGADAFGMVFPIIGIVVASVLLIVLLVQTFYLVKTNEIAVVERFGRFTRMGRAGLNVKIPIVDRVVNRLTLRVVQMDEQVSTITHDKVTVRLNVSVQYRVSEALEEGEHGSVLPTAPGGSLYRANYALTDVADQISSYVFDAVRSTVPDKTLDEVFAEKDHIAQAVEDRLSSTMGQYGYEIVRTLVTGISPDQEVEQAMNRINAAERLKEASRAEAEAYRIKIVGEATGEKEAKQLSGEGVAAQRGAIAKGLAVQHEELKRAGIENADTVLLMNQYFDTMATVAKQGSATTLFLPGGADAVSTIEAQIRNGTLQSAAANSAPAAGARPPQPPAPTRIVGPPPVER